ncbi:S8 family peptidase [Alienimonas sp. DA493]|uniref:S8 family peptidase n=1 Tax=Alienimonas sp. DA493 TaxID=3373605 RepID=UPI00375512AF
MDDRPLLQFPDPDPIERAKRQRPRPKVVPPGRDAQVSRLDARMEALLSGFTGATLDPSGVAVEQVVVFETYGDKVADFAMAAREVEELYWLADIDVDEAPPADGFAVEKKPGESIPVRIYGVSATQAAIETVLGLWRSWKATGAVPHGLGRFKDVFEFLKDVRRWEVKDRLADNRVVEAWRADLEERRDAARFEIELWFHDRPERQAAAETATRVLVREAGGKIVTRSVLPAIRYHGLLAELPADGIRELLDGIEDDTHTAMLRCEGVMFFRPRPQTSFAVPADDGDAQPPDPVQEAAGEPLPDAPPVVALLDGVPMQAHDALHERIVLDDPDDWQSEVEVRHRSHATAMASLIVHGDLNDRGEPLPSKLYVRPVLLPQPASTPSGLAEQFPPDELIVDLIHRAVVRMKDGPEPVAPSVKVVNLSLGDEDRPFLWEMSPLARLLDWLARKYDLLFVVSVGNHPEKIDVAMSPKDWEAADVAKRRRAVLRALWDVRRHRRPLAPAEAINALTVGSHHSDASTLSEHDRRRFDLFEGAALPSPQASVATGFGRMVKPEILMPGGRVMYDRDYGTAPDGVTRLVSSNYTRPPGQLTAAPPPPGKGSGHAIHTRGSSNAAALASRLAGLAAVRVVEIGTRTGDTRSISPEGVAVLLKALLVHGASWGGMTETLMEEFEEFVSTKDKKVSYFLKQDMFSRFLGYGLVDPEKVLFNTPSRVTAVATGVLKGGEAHAYKLPLPASIPAASNIKRRVTATLAWNSPINVRHRAYRQAHLWMTRPGDRDCEEDPLDVKRTSLNQKASQRGTVEHAVWEHHRPFAVADEADFHVHCREAAGRFSGAVRYGLAVTLDVAVGTGVDLHVEMADRILERVKLRSEPTPVGMGTL